MGEREREREREGVREGEREREEGERERERESEREKKKQMTVRWCNLASMRQHFKIIVATKCTYRSRAKNQNQYRNSSA